MCPLAPSRFCLWPPSLHYRFQKDPFRAGGKGMGTAVPVALLGRVQPVLPSLGFSGSWNTLPLPSARRTERCGVLVAPHCPVAPPPISSRIVPPGGTLLLSALPGALPSRCVGGPPRPALCFLGTPWDTQDASGHFPLSLVLCPHPCFPFTIVPKLGGP